MLCELCGLSIFNGSLAPKLSYMPQRHHATVESLLESVRQKCFICANIWGSCAESARELLPIGASKSSLTTYYLNAISGGGGLQLDVQIQAVHLVKRFSLQPVADDSLAPPSIDSFATNTGSQKSLAQAQSWLMKCRSSHPMCSQPEQSFIPTRLLDVREPISRSSKTYVRSSQEDFSEIPAYATLSHCWGASAMTLKLTESTSKAMHRGIRYSDHPKTFRDAITITQSLGLGYLWIDSLCIIQDSLGDWCTESARMGHVYSNAMCNIAATKSTNSHGGCFADRDPALIARCIVIANWDGIPHTRYEVIVEDFWTEQISMAPLNQRAWVLQERVLSPRILHFASNQIFWECQAHSGCESYPLGLPSFMEDELDILDRAFSARTLRCLLEDFRVEMLTHSSGEGQSGVESQSESKVATDMDGVYRYWDRIVQTYLSCGLTKPGDKLAALSGLAQFVEKRLKVEYLAGIWRQHLPEQLNWRINPDVKACSTRAPEYRAPSWSWASIDGPILPRRSTNEEKCLIKVLGAITFPAIAGQTGPVKNAYLKLRASILQLDGLVLRTGSTLDLISFGGGRLRCHLTIQPDVSLPHGEGGADIPPPCGEFEGSLWLMPITQSIPQPWITGLVLKRTHGQNFHFQRIGHFEAMDVRICLMFSSTEVGDHDRQMGNPRAVDAEITIE